MTDPIRPDIDLEKELVRYMVEHRITRRMLLEQIAKVGAFAALAPIIAACTGGRRLGLALGARDAVPTPAPTVAPSVAAVPTATPAPTPPPVPEKELHIWNYAEYMGEDVIPSFEEKIKKDYKVDIKVTLRLLRHLRGDVRQGHRRPDRVRHHLPGLDRRAGVGRDRQDPAARPVAHPEQGQPRARVVEPGLRPGQRALDAVHVVDDRRRLRQRQGQGVADQLEGALGRALEGPHRDARRPA